MAAEDAPPAAAGAAGAAEFELGIDELAEDELEELETLDELELDKELDELCCEETPICCSCGWGTSRFLM